MEPTAAVASAGGWGWSKPMTWAASGTADVGNDTSTAAAAAKEELLIASAAGWAVSMARASRAANERAASS